jgi:hypothetical protein
MGRGHSGGLSWDVPDALHLSDVPPACVVIGERSEELLPQNSSRRLSFGTGPICGPICEGICPKTVLEPGCRSLPPVGTFIWTPLKR